METYHKFPIMSAPLQGFLRGIGAVILFGILNYVGTAANLNGIVSASAATVISGLALALEHYLNAPVSSPTTPAA